MRFTVITVNAYMAANYRRRPAVRAGAWQQWYQYSSPRLDLYFAAAKLRVSHACLAVDPQR